MDKYQDAFVEEFGQPTCMVPAGDQRLLEFETKLPPRLISYWRTFGFSGFKNGLFWITDPTDYEDALDTWLGDTKILEEDAFHVIARSGFGDLFLWGERSGYRYLIKPARGLILAKDGAQAEIGTQGPDGPLARFFAVVDCDYCDMSDAAGHPLFERAVARLGPLASDEVLAFEPSLIAGGTPDIKSIAKRNVHVHLALLAQFGRRELLNRQALTKKAFG